MQLTKDAVNITLDNHRRLQTVEFEDKAILQITLIGIMVQLHQSGR